MANSEKKQTLNQWLETYAYDNTGKLTTDNFLKKSNIQNFLNANLINNRVAMNFFGLVEEFDNTKTYNKADKVKVTKIEEIDGEQYTQNISLWISQQDNNSQEPSFDNRAWWMSVSRNVLATYISDESIIASILALKNKLPRLYGCYPQKPAYVILGIILMAELYYVYCNTLDTGGNGIGDALLTSKTMHNLSYSAKVPDYKLLANMASFNTPFGQIALNYIIPLIIRPFTLSSNRC